MELIDVYDLDGKFISSMERDAYYKQVEEEFTQTGMISTKIRQIRVILLNPNGQIFLQKRSNTKEYNSGLYDKTVGGHVESNHTWHMTVVRECAEELGFPAAILTLDEFNKAIPSTDLNVIGIFRELDYRENHESVRVHANSTIILPCMAMFFIGYYDGSIRFSDGEASGIETHTLMELKDDIIESPQKYTEDLKFMVEQYGKYLVPVSEL